MLSSFWAGVGGKLADRWAAVAAPALVFWLGGLLAYAYSRNGFFTLAHKLDKWSAPAQLAVLATTLLGVAASGIVVQRLTTPCLRLLEGYWPAWLDPLRQRLIRRAQRRAVADDDAAQGLAQHVFGEAGATAAQLMAFARLEQRRRLRPQEATRLMPTHIGNILRAAEIRPARRYGLDAVVVWPRLWLVLPDVTRQELLSARSALDSAVAAAIWGVLFCVFSVWTAFCAPLGLAVAAVAIVGWVPARAEGFGDLLEAAYDLHRSELYRQLRWPLPDDPGTERGHGERLTRYLLRGPGKDDPVFSPPPDGSGGR